MTVPLRALGDRFSVSIFVGLKGCTRRVCELRRGGSVESGGVNPRDTTHDATASPLRKPRWGDITPRPVLCRPCGAGGMDGEGAGLGWLTHSLVAPAPSE